MSDFKKNPAQILREAGDKPLAMLSHNRTAFYMVTPGLFGALVENLADRELEAIVRKRLTLKDTAVEVNIDQI